MRFHTKKIFVSFILLFLLASSSLAIQIRELPIASEIHMGFCSGIGAGINIGFSGGWDLFDLTIGPEIEQVLTDIDYKAELGSTRVGAFVKTGLFYENLFINLHLGIYEFQIGNRDIDYSSGGNNYTLYIGNRYSGKYQAISLDYVWQDYNFSPKFYINNINGQGSVTEFDFNIGRSF
ncbi:MAG: hypothetical protein ABIA67_01050 [Candidatus Margulisiibacteriota bacterium]